MQYAYIRYSNMDTEVQYNLGTYIMKEKMFWFTESIHSAPLYRRPLCNRYLHIVLRATSKQE